MDLKKMVDKAKDMVEDRGGTDALKEDAQEVADAVKEKGSITDKAKDVVEAVKDPGSNDDPGADDK
jgi:polyhydroxyalkanoate synthesis regulator phasin